MADEYVVASLAAGALSTAPASARVASFTAAALATGSPQAQIASLTASALTTGSVQTPALIGSFAIEVLQSIAAPASRRRQTIVAARGRAGL
jgi:hypothetical protein